MVETVSDLITATASMAEVEVEVEVERAGDPCTRTSVRSLSRARRRGHRGCDPGPDAQLVVCAYVLGEVVPGSGPEAETQKRSLLGVSIEGAG